MRRTAIMSALAVLLLGVLPVAQAAAGSSHRCCRRGHAYGYSSDPGYIYGPFGYVVPARPFDAWRDYYTAQAEVSFARRSARGNYYVATGRTIPSRYFGPPTNAYAENYALNPYLYFSCPLARRGEGTCDTPDFFQR